MLIGKIPPLKIHSFMAILRYVFTFTVRVKTPSLNKNPSVISLFCQRLSPSCCFRLFGLHAWACSPQVPQIIIILYDDGIDAEACSHNLEGG